MTSRTQSPKWLERLLEPAACGHPVVSPRLVETHISWLLLTGKYVYKIKKPVSLAFLDFSTLALRQKFCREEVRVNRRYAPELYLGVVAITGDKRRPRIDGTGQPFEYAVKMHQFDQGQLLSALIDEGTLTEEHIDELAAVIADFHDGAEVMAPISEEEALARSWKPAEDILGALRETIRGPAEEELLQIQAWMSAQPGHALFAHRAREGRWRECHGDLHLDNIVVWQERVTLFDGIEFDPNLRWIDVICDLAFALMDLNRRGRPDLAFRLLNGYLERTGDYAGLGVLAYYQVYRLLVRARVRAVRLAQENRSEAMGTDLAPYLAQARLAMDHSPGAIVLVHGVSGSGKSHWARILGSRLAMIRLRSDRERQRLCLVDDVRYSGHGRALAYERLEELAHRVLNAGFSPLVDATFLEASQRERFRSLARDYSLPLVIVSFSARSEVLEARVRRRKAHGRDPSEAGVGVLRAQLDAWQPIGSGEAGQLVEIDTSDDPAPAMVVGRVKAALAR